MIRPRACWGAACDLLGMSVVYPAGGTVTISKKSPLIRILSKRTDCIDFEENVKTRLCRGRRPRRPAEVGGGANRPGRGNPPYGVKDQRAVMERPRAGHARPLQGGNFCSGRLWGIRTAMGRPEGLRPFAAAAHLHHSAGTSVASGCAVSSGCGTFASRYA